MDKYIWQASVTYYWKLQVCLLGPPWDLLTVYNTLWSILAHSRILPTYNFTVLLFLLCLKRRRSEWNSNWCSSSCHTCSWLSLSHPSSLLKRYYGNGFSLHHIQSSSQKVVFLVYQVNKASKINTCIAFTYVAGKYSQVEIIGALPHLGGHLIG